MRATKSELDLAKMVHNSSHNSLSSQQSQQSSGSCNKGNKMFRFGGRKPKTSVENSSLKDSLMNDLKSDKKKEEKKKPTDSMTTREHLKAGNVEGALVKDLELKPASAKALVKE
jgi:hypothetical protein